jgi:endonuclease G
MRRWFVIVFVSCTASQPPRPAENPPSATPAAQETSPHLLLGTPRDADPSDDVLLDRQWFVVSYNPKRNVANWVAWKLQASDLGPVSRTNRFHRDEALGANFRKVDPSDFLHSGYDRGHLCPSGDRTSSPEANHATFVMTNIHPQRHDLNAGPWEALESWSRDEARKHKVLYIVAGGIFSPTPPTIGHDVAVPEKSFKVLVELDPNQGPSDVRLDTPAVAVMMPNQAGIIDRAWTEFLTSIDDVERASGYDFYDRIPKSVQDAIEARTWSKP